MTRRRALLLTCEHASAAIPADLREQLESFHGGRAILQTHQAYDIGALEAAEGLAERLGVEVLAAPVSRLVVDANRHRRHRRVLGPAFADETAERKEAILRAHHDPHRARVEAALRGSAPVLHVAVHSMTPRLEGHVRFMDMAVLYDPTRTTERVLAEEWKRRMHQRLPSARLRRNAPYRGTSDGLPTWVRRSLDDRQYVGFELELNQRAFTPRSGWSEGWLDALAETLDELAAC